MASEFIFNNEQHNISLDLQYINPSCHRELLQIIVDTHRKTLANTIKESLHLLYTVMALLTGHRLIINKDAHEQRLFVGTKEFEETGAAGCLNTLKDSCTETEAGMDFSILQEVSSIVTDGTNMNSEERGGLWALIKKLRQQQVSEKVSLVPLIKIWCAVRHSNLARKSVTDIMTTELKVVIEELKSISTYFHTSGARTRERKENADEHNLPTRRYPVYFQIRFTGFFLSS